MRTLISIVFVCLTVSDAVAQSEDKLDNVSDGNVLANKGFIQYQNKNYGKAIFYWQKALQIQEVGLLYHSIAKAYEKKGEFKAALKYANKAKASKGSPLTTKYQKKNEALITRLQKAIATKHAQERQAKIDATRYQLDWRGYTGIGTTAVSLVLLGLMGYQNNQAAKGLERLQPPQRLNRDQYDELKLKVEGHQSLGQIYLYSGLALMAVGVTLFSVDFFGVNKNVDMSASVGPTSFSVKVSF